MKMAILAAALCVLTIPVMADELKDQRDDAWSACDAAAPSVNAPVDERIKGAECYLSATGDYITALKKVKREAEAATAKAALGDAKDKWDYAKRLCGDQRGTSTYMPCLQSARDDFEDKFPDFTPPAEAKPKPTKSAFRTRKSRSLVDDSPSVFITAYSNENLPMGRYKDAGRLELMMRCLENTTSFILSHGDAFFADTAGFGKVRFRLDDDRAFSRNMVERSDNQGLGLWSGRRSIPIIRDMFGHDRLLVEIQPYNESPRTFTFNISNLEDAVRPLREACNW